MISVLLRILQNSGMKCCHMDLFQSMHGTVMDMKDEDTFDAIDRRQIAAVND